VENFKGKNVAVLGWGINGVDAAKYLLSHSANVTVLDRNPNLKITEVNKAKINFIKGVNYLRGLKKYNYIFRAPAVYRYLPELVDAERSGVIVTSVLKLFCDLCPGKIIGVTGTKGKGTTSTLIYEILKNQGKDVYLAGNIGDPVLNLLPKLTKKSLVVLELSSFQLIDLTKSPHIGVVLNITLDHMDWHQGSTEYVRAKESIVSHQNTNNLAVINADYSSSKRFEKLTGAKKYYFSKNKIVKGSYVNHGTIYLDTDGKKIEIGRTGDLLLKGEHNWENVTAAICAASLAGAKPGSIKKTIYSFKGLEHRLELVRDVKGVKFYNDSFSTNPQTTIAAINSFSEPMSLILGGSDKGLEYNEMGMVIANKKNIENIILIGDITDIIYNALLKANCTKNIIKMGKPKMKQIVKKCLELTPKGGVVVLSPATASFDMFPNYKERGNQFKKEVNKL